MPNTLISIVSLIHDSVSMTDVLRFYGLTTKTIGRIPCPLHNGKDNNFSYNEKYYHCFVCGESGDVISFVMRYFNLPFKDALKRLNEDFSLNLPLDAPLDRKAKQSIARRKQIADTQKAFDAWRVNTIKQLAECFRLAHLAKKWCSPASWTQPMIDAVKEQVRVEDWLYTLDGSDLEKQVQIFRQRKEVRAVCERILNPLQMN